MSIGSIILSTLTLVLLGLNFYKLTKYDPYGFKTICKSIKTDSELCARVLKTAVQARIYPIDDVTFDHAFERAVSCLESEIDNGQRISFGHLCNLIDFYVGEIAREDSKSG